MRFDDQHPLSQAAFSRLTGCGCLVLALLLAVIVVNLMRDAL